MKTFLVSILAAGAVFAQADTPLPAYLGGGGAYNQLAGANFWATAIVPVSTVSGLYESTTTDLFPVKTKGVNGTTAYIFQASVREGIHKVIYQGSKPGQAGNSMLTIGGDAGFSFAQAAAAGSAGSGVSAAVTITYIRQLSKNWALMVPIRALYMPSLGGWNPIVEFGFVWKPGK